MNCCDGTLLPAFQAMPAPADDPHCVRTMPAGRGSGVDPAFLRHDADGTAHLELLLPDMHCAGCLGRVERTALSVPGVRAARANLTTRRLAVALDEDGAADAVLAALVEAGENVRPFDAASFEASGDKAAGGELLRAMAVAGFAAANVMLLSVSVWSGADGPTRDLFHWISALIALPAIAYSGRPFFRSAVRALAHGRTNMDVPISIGVVVAAGMSLYETATGGEHAWFDASVSLIFFLLVGRYLDHRMRDVARGAAARLLSLTPTTALMVAADGALRLVPVRTIEPGAIVRVAPGERIPVDGEVTAGSSDVDRAMLTGESLPEAVAPGRPVHAGTMNLTGQIDISVTARPSETLLAQIVRLMEKVERPDGRFVRIADRAARHYAPFVHSLAALTFLGWMAIGEGWHPALTAAVAVLIITCPCALGLAVPAVQVVAASRLLSRGIIIKGSAALERLAEIDTVVFDKTGTLTEGAPRLVASPDLGAEGWSVAAGLAGASRHPLAKVIAEAAPDGIGGRPEIDAIAERPGLGVEGSRRGTPVRLGRLEWVGGTPEEDASDGRTAVWLRIGEAAPVAFRFADRLRADAAGTVAALKALGLDLRIVSGDTPRAVGEVAGALGLATGAASCLPGGKVEILERLAAEGRRVLMVGDGLNDAPALAAAHVSMSPSSGSDITQAAADAVFTGTRLEPVVLAVATARAARRKTFENFALAIGYNVLAVPVAVLGFATPLVAAVAMSSSSILVIANALTLPLSLPRPLRRRPAAAASANTLAEGSAP